jgi:hypothetical protein
MLEILFQRGGEREIPERRGDHDLLRRGELPRKIEHRIAEPSRADQLIPPLRKRSSTAGNASSCRRTYSTCPPVLTGMHRQSFVLESRAHSVHKSVTGFTSASWEKRLGALSTPTALARRSEYASNTPAAGSGTRNARTDICEFSRTAGIIAYVAHCYARDSGVSARNRARASANPC